MERSSCHAEKRYAETSSAYGRIRRTVTIRDLNLQHRLQAVSEPPDFPRKRRKSKRQYADRQRRVLRFTLECGYYGNNTHDDEVNSN